MYIGGAWVSNGSSTPRVHIDPATGEASGPYVAAGSADADAAVAAAREAFPGWRATPPAKRRELLLALADAVERAADDLTAILTLEMGQPVRAGAAGVGLAAEWFRYYAGWTDKLDGSVAPVAPRAVLDYVMPEPYGVVVAIIPWNGPMLSLALKLAPALAAGNCVVLKPPEQTPFSGLAFARALRRGRGPTGSGERRSRRRRGRRGAVRSSGRRQDHLHRRCERRPARSRPSAAEHHTPVVLELGGKSASIVFDDADPEVAGKLAAVLGVQQNTGQGCFLPTRVFVQRPRYDEVVDRIVETVDRHRRSATPSMPTTSMGPVAGEAACARILDVIDARPHGGDGTLLIGGGRAGGDLARGTYRRADGLRRRRPRQPTGAGGDLRSGAGGRRLRRRGRGSRPRQPHPLRPRRLRVDQRPRSGPPRRGARSTPATCR